MVLDTTGSRLRIVHRPLPQDDARQRHPDIGRAARALGWAPSVPLAQGLGRTIAAFRDGLAATASANARAG